MIRFIDLRGADTGYNFAFWNTITDKFLTLGDDQAWDTVDDLHECTNSDGVDIDRLINLCPAWAYKGK